MQHKVNQHPHNEKGDPHGYWSSDFFKGNYVNGRLFGLCTWFHDSKTFYQHYYAT